MNSRRRHAWRDAVVRLVRAVDWSQLWYPGPTRRFTDEELERAGNRRPSATFWVIGALNFALLAVAPLVLAPTAVRPAIVLVALVSMLALAWTSARMWRNPTRWRLMLCILGWSAGGLLLHLALAEGVGGFDRVARRWVIHSEQAVAVMCMMSLWALALYRSHQIDGRLKELAERDEALALARRLSAAQLQPHFLFNTLASIQHWVETGDARAGATLRSLTDYLRALLPMFERPVHPLADELAAMQRYLEVMQARLGDRLAWHFEGEVPPHAAVPPGLGLTLLENAVEHGVQPSLHGAQVQVRVSLREGRARLEVLDTGPGLPHPVAEGVGLRNCRQRLRQAFGERAALALHPRDDGPGAVAAVLLPLPDPTST